MEGIHRHWESTVRREGSLQGPWPATMTQAGSATGLSEVSGHLCSFPSVQPFLPACQDTG